MIKYAIISIVSFLLFIGITPSSFCDNYKVCYSIFAKELTGSDTGIAVVKTVDASRLSQNSNENFVDWNVELKTQKDILKLFLVFINRSKLTLDEAFFELIKISRPIERLETGGVISLEGGPVYKVLSEKTSATCCQHYQRIL